MSELEKLDNNLDSITRSLDEIDGLLQPLFGEQNIDKLAETISLVYMKVNGFSVKDHKINTELARVKTYMQKVKASQEQKKIEDVQPKNPNQINQQVLSRIIQSTESHNQRVLEQQSKDWQEAQDKMELEAANPLVTAQKSQQKKLHRGALIPSGGHLNWKDQINEILK